MSWTRQKEPASSETSAPVHAQETADCQASPVLTIQHVHTTDDDPKGPDLRGEIPSYLRADPPANFQRFCEEVLAVDKSLVGGEADPTDELISATVRMAPQSFWMAAADQQMHEPLRGLVRRIRNWISVLSRRKAYSRIVPALILLSRLPLSDNFVVEMGIPGILRTLVEEKEAREVVNIIKTFMNEHKSAFSNTTNSDRTQPESRSSIPKLFSEVGASKLRTHKRARAPSPPSEPASQKPDSASDASMDEFTEVPTAKRFKKAKKVHWKPDSDLVAVRYFEMDGIAKFKSAKNARQQEHDEGSAMHPHIQWIPPREISFADSLGNEQVRALISTRRGGLKIPDSEEARIQEKRESSVPRVDKIESDSPKEPSPEDAIPDPSWRPKEGGKFTAANPPREWLQKHNMLHNGVNQHMNPMMQRMPSMPAIPNMPAMPTMAPPMMQAFPWAMNYPMNMNMNMGMSSAQMNEMMKMSANMFGKQ